jgi:hypothetical protein
MAWREIKTTDMQSNKMKFTDAVDALNTYLELHSTMNTAKGYDYSQSVAADTTGETFGMDEYLTLKHTFQVAARDVGYDLWVMWMERNCGKGKTLKELESLLPHAKRMLAIVTRAVESELRKRNMLLHKEGK